LSPDTRHHRGAHPEDRRLFDQSRLPFLRQAVSDLSWLLSQSYALTSSLKLVGDRYGLTQRQRLAASRAACSDQQLEHRKSTCINLSDIRSQPIIVDGFNLIITIEAALAGGMLLLCRDGCIRDLSGVHGSYRSVDETELAIELIRDALQELGPESVRWVLDQPVSNSGRLAQRIARFSGSRGSYWKADVVMSPDAEIVAGHGQIAITSDSVVLDKIDRWANLTSDDLVRRLSNAWIVDLKGIDSLTH
jgi:hypothetical protein